MLSGGVGGRVRGVVVVGDGDVAGVGVVVVVDVAIHVGHASGICIYCVK